MSSMQAVLGDVVRLIETGRSPKTLEREAAPNEPGVLKVSAVSWGRFDPAAAKAMPESFAAPESHRVRHGDFIVSRANTIELTGAVAISEQNYPNRYLSDKLLRLVLDDSRVIPEFLMYAMRGPRARRHIERFASGTSDSMRNIAQDALLRTPLTLPPIGAQQEQISWLRCAFGEISTAVNAAAEQLRATHLLRASSLKEFLGCDPVSAGPGQRGSVAIRLLSVARLESGHTPSRRRPDWWVGPVPWLALPDIRKLHGKLALETIETINDAGLANSSARLLPVGTVCLCRDASIGFVTMLGRPMATSQHFCNWICDPESLDPEFLMYAFMASFDYLRALGSGSVLKTIYMPTIQSFHISAPSIDEQRRIARTLREQLAAAEALQKRLAERQVEIERLPQRILAAAFGDAD